MATFADLDWTAPRFIMTRRGARWLRTATPTETFWEIWRAAKDDLKSAGITVTKRAGSWQVFWWAEEANPEPLNLLNGSDEFEDHNLPVVVAAPLNDSRLLDWQQAHAGMLLSALETFGGALDASDTGTGKTYVACAIAAHLGQPLFVVAPKAVLPAWRRIAALFHVPIQTINYEMLRRGNEDAVSRKGKTFTWHLPKDTLVVFDECHRCKDATTLNAKMALAAVGRYKVLALSATAADNPLHMRFVCNLTGIAQSSRSYREWCSAHSVYPGRWGGYEFRGGPQVLARIHKQIFGRGRGSRIRIADLGDAFPATQIAAEAYDLGVQGEVERVYTELAARIATLRRQKNAAANILVEQLRARQEVELLKTGGLAAMAKDAVEEGAAVALFVNFNESVDRLMETLGTKCVIRGGQSDMDRQRHIAAFQADREPVIVANIAAGGVGVSLHGNSPQAKRRLALIAPSWSAQDLKQALGRVHRAGGAPSLQRIVFCAGTIEEDVCAAVAKKLARIEALNDGDVVPNLFNRRTQ